jgi:uncharacterized membrane protein YoaK (UPF0700 family)
MSMLGRVGAIVSHEDVRHGPLPRLLLLLTLVTGLVDAASYLALGNVFVANMTGNVIFLGFSVAGASQFPIAASLVAMAAFLAGAVAGGRIGKRFWRHRGRFLAVAMMIEVVLVAAALVVAIMVRGPFPEGARYGQVVLLAIAMGTQNAMARRLAVPDLMTTVLTSTLTGFAAESSLAGGPNPRPLRRVAAVVAMFLGAGIGTALLFRLGTPAVLGLALVVLAVADAIAWRHAASSAGWTVGTE